MARTMQDLSEDVLINETNATLAHWDSYLDYLKTGIKQDTLTHCPQDCTPHVNASLSSFFLGMFPDHLS